MRAGIKPPVLLADADYRGTLAAVRSLGRAGVPVVVARSDPFAVAAWSRHATDVVDCPDVGAEPAAFVDWLFDYGRRCPGTVLLPTSDDLAFLLARHRDALARHFVLSVPPVEVVLALLDKWRLNGACRAAGVAAPEAWLPRTDEDLAELARESVFPLVLKPRTQALLAPHQKGRVARRPAELALLHRELRAATRHSRLVLDFDRDLSLPMLQRFEERARASIYGLSGFVDASGAPTAVRASRKVLQWPRTLGVGLCFEEAETDRDVVQGVERLCRHVGYSGLFEVELLETDGGRRLIDFNPRFYGEMAFDVARGLDLPLYAYLEAVGAREELSHALERGRACEAPEDRAYCDRAELAVTLGLMRAAGRSSREERASWRSWLAAHRGRTTDAVLDPHDPRPGAIAAANAVARRMRHPRSTWRSARAG